MLPAQIQMTDILQSGWVYIEKAAGKSSSCFSYDLEPGRRRKQNAVTPA